MENSVYLDFDDILSHEYENLILNDFDLVKIESVEKLEDFHATVYDLSIANNRNYVVSNLGVVHNGGRRAGAGTVALPIWHNDILDFLDMQTEHGDPRLKAYDVFPQVCIPDIFMERDRTQQSWVTFCPFEVKNTLGIDIVNLYGDDFTQAYLKIESAYNDGKLKVATKHNNARDITKTIMKTQFETGLPYIAFTDTMNEFNPNKYDEDTEGIVCGNLCVAPETKILTSNGYEQISELEGMEVDVWNGEEFSKTTVVKTGNNQKLIKVKTSGGQELECTEYHKFYILNRDNPYDAPYEEVRACQLKIGDKLIKFDLPIIEGNQELMYAYDNGFYTADGCAENGKARIYLYHGKQKLKPYLTSVEKWRDEIDNGNRSVGTSRLLKEKYFVPSNKYTIKSRLEWFSGLCDGDGTIARNGTNESIQITSIHFEFLKELQLMLQTLGVTSKIQKLADACEKLLPKNDGTGEYGYYNCKDAYRILISSSGLFKLAELGFVTNRLKWVHRMPQRCAEQFIQIIDIVDEGRYDDTYCFSEPLRHMGMFNGILTGQCQESFSNVKSDTYGHVCNLASINMSNIHSFDELAKVSAISTKMLDYGISLTNNPDSITKNHNDKYRTIGIGIMGLHDFLAYQFKSFKDFDLIRKVSECIEYNAVKSSIELAKRFGRYPAFESSLWKTGEMIDKFKQYTSGEYDWDSLQSEIDKHGIRNSQLTSPPPTTSTSLYQDCSASVLPIYRAFFMEDNKQGKIAVAAKYLAHNPLGYGKTQSKFRAEEIIDVVSEIQKFVDTGVSMELIFDQNREDFSAKDLYDAIHYAHQKKIKNIYYIRSIKKNESLIEKADSCVACAG